MNSVQYLLSVLLISALTSSCALGMGRNRCDPPVLPSRPLEKICVSATAGMGDCYDEVTQKNSYEPINNFVCHSARDHMTQEQWIDAILKAEQ